MEHEKDERTLGLSTAQVAGSALAAVSGAILASTAGVTGTVIGAAIASVVATVGAAIYTWSLRRTTVAVKKTAAQVRQAALVSGPLPRTVVQGPLRTLKERAAAKSSEQDPGQESEDPESEEDSDEDSWRRAIPWGKVLLASLAITVVALAGITVVEAITGKPISSVTGGSDSQGTTVGNVTGRDTSQQDTDPSDKSTPGSDEEKQDEQAPDEDSEQQDPEQQDPEQQDNEQEDPEPSAPATPEPSDGQSVVPEGAPAP